MSRNLELSEIIQQHRRWLESAKKQGQRADFSGAELNGADLSNCDLSGAVLRGASLKGVNLRSSQLIHTDFSDACLQNADLSGTNLMLTNFTGADLQYADLSGTSSGSGGRLGEMVRGPRFKDANLTGANLSNSYYAISDFLGASMSGVQLSGTVLERANLANINLSGIQLCGTNLANASLQGCNLSGADLQLARLTDINLSNADLTGCNLCGADLRAANLQHAKVNGIKCNRKTRFRGIRINGCYGSSRFKRYAEDQDYIEEFKEAQPISYRVWLILTDCGRSMLRVVLWSFILSMIFALIFYALGENAFEVSQKETLGWSLFTTVYYSVVTFTTLGFGDIAPRTPLAAGFVMLEVVVGYIMLGILISILATKIARRS